MTHKEIAQVLETAADILETEKTYNHQQWADQDTCSVCQVGALGLAIERVLFPDKHPYNSLTVSRVLMHSDLLNNICEAAWGNQYRIQGNAYHQKRNFPNGAPDVIRDLREKAAMLTEQEEDCSTVTDVQPVEVS